MQVVVADTRLDPATALQELQVMAQNGIRIVIGPQTSAEVRALMYRVREQLPIAR